MIFEWDENKRTKYLEKHGLDFHDAQELWLTAGLVKEDIRSNYGEQRFVIYGLLKNRVGTCAFTMRNENTIRIISFRKANQREKDAYEKNIKT